MLNVVKDKELLYLQQITKVWTCFKSFPTLEKKELFANFCDNITIKEGGYQSDLAIKKILDNKALVEHIGDDNLTYLLDFVKIITNTKSVALKDKMMELVQAMAE